MLKNTLAGNQKSHVCSKRWKLVGAGTGCGKRTGCPGLSSDLGAQRASVLPRSKTGWGWGAAGDVKVLNFFSSSTCLQLLFHASSRYHMFTDFKGTINARGSSCGLIHTFVHLRYPHPVVSSKPCPSPPPAHPLR